MNCQTSQEQLLRAQDGLLPQQQQPGLDAHLSACPACREFQASLEQVAAGIKNEAASVPVPEFDETWKNIQSRLHTPEATKPISKRVAPIIWITAPLAAAAALVFAFLPGQSTSEFPSLSVSETSITQVDYVETDDPNATTMVYVDKQSGWLVVWADDSAVTNG